MTPIPRRLATLLSTAMLIVLAGAGHRAAADDTEIFVAEPPAGTNTAANIMFIIDTSGSMDTEVVTQEAYNPSTTYSGDCEVDRVYWEDGNNNAPRCSGRNETDQYVDEDNFLCQTHLGTLTNAGLVSIAYVAQYRDRSRNRSVWEALSGGRNSEVECKDDMTPTPSDGQAVDDSRYPRDSSTGNPYGTTAVNDAWWNSNSRNDTYTFYTGNYLNYLDTGGTVIGTRIEIVKEVTKSTLDRLSNVNVGLTIFNSNSSDNQGGRVIYPVTPIETAREDIKTLVDGLDANGSTPLSETLYEVYRYWAGESPRYANSASSTRVGGTGNFISPLGEENVCAKNYNVYLTDGEPTSDTDVNDVVPGLTDFIGTDLANPDQCSDNSTGGDNGKCLDDIAKYMFTKDLVSSSAFVDYVTTYTVGFGDDVRGSTTLAAAAEAGGGRAYDAFDTASLSNVFETIIREIISQDTSFTAPAVSVNAFNRTQNLNDLFITVFQPSGNLHWPGNLKKYSLKADGTIIDVNDRGAVDPNTGFFAENSQSYWSAGIDGPDVELGGAANEFPLPADRKVYTDLGALTSTHDDAGIQLDGVRDNEVTTSNDLITDTVVGLDAGASLTEIDTMIQWIRGGNVDGGAPDEARFKMGDPLHARPVSVIYGGTTSDPDIDDAVVFSATNDGYLHAIHPNGNGTAGAGEELWTFVPSELLPRMAALRENDASADKGYGLDGNIIAYKLDHNRDGIVDPDDDDRVLLFFGMGRGGYNYYALDVTNKTDPKFLWRKGRDDIMPGLGQTWSSPIITRVKVGDGSSQNPDHLVMIVGGGYDPTQDSVPYNVDSSGNRIFMVDAIKGTLLWHAGPTNDSTLGYDSTANFTHAKMTHSVPADIRVLDLTNDGYADRMYMADTGGQVWRFDIFNGRSAGTGASTNGSAVNSLVTGGVFASLGNAHLTTHPVASSRRFYNAPDVSLMRIDGSFVINIALGSGYRGHPINDEIQDRFYSLRDKAPFQPYVQSYYNSTLVAITEADSNLIDVTGVAAPTVASTALGWKLLLNDPDWQGEKVLSEARTFNNKILFSTFTPVPSESATNSCVVSGVKNTFYAINALNGQILVQNDLQQTGIAPTPVILFPPPDPPPPPPPPCEGDDCPPPPPPPECVGTECTPPPVCLVGLENCGVELTNAPVRTFWTQQNTDTTN